MAKKHIKPEDIVKYCNERSKDRDSIPSDEREKFDARTAEVTKGMSVRLGRQEIKQAAISRKIRQMMAARKQRAEIDDAMAPRIFMRNILASSVHGLGLDEKRLMALVSSKIAIDSDVDEQIEVTAKEFGETFKLSETRRYVALAKAAESINYAEIDWKESPLYEFTDRRWVSGSEYCNGDGKAKIKITPSIVHLLRSSKHGRFMTYKLHDFAKLKTLYGQRLYELLMQFADTGFYKVRLADFIKVMEVPETYIQDFGCTNKRVIKPALKDISQNFKVTCEYVKTGSSVTGLEFKFGKRKK